MVEVGRPGYGPSSTGPEGSLRRREVLVLGRTRPVTESIRVGVTVGTTFTVDM